MFKKGQRVAIINRTMSGKFMFEGYAKVLDGPHNDEYGVRFEDDCDEAVRFIDPAAQEDPVGFCIKLNTFTTV